MNKHQLCCIGHITLDKVVTPQNTVYMPGGTAFYCSHAIRHFNDIDYALVTAVGATEMNVVEQLRELDIDVTALPSKYSVYFENIYGANPDDRTQRVLAKADPFTATELEGVNAEIYHLGSLLADDFSLEVIKALSRKGRQELYGRHRARAARVQSGCGAVPRHRYGYAHDVRAVARFPVSARAGDARRTRPHGR